MPRRVFDIILTTLGAALTLVLLLAGILLTWGSSFTSGQVHDQLAAQKIFFPAKGSPALAPKEIGPFLNKYAGQQLTTGDQAEAYADHFIAVHVKEIGGGKTYSEISSEQKANPNDPKLADTKMTLFQGQTLRGMLLNAYAFGTIAKIMLISAIVSYVGAVIMLVLTLLGVAHLRKVKPEDMVLTGKPATA